MQWFCWYLEKNNMPVIMVTFFCSVTIYLHSLVSGSIPRRRYQVPSVLHFPDMEWRLHHCQKTLNVMFVLFYVYHYHKKCFSLNLFYILYLKLIDTETCRMYWRIMVINTQLVIETDVTTPHQTAGPAGSVLPTNTVAPPGIMRQQARREREMAQQSARELSQAAGVPTDHSGDFKTLNFTGRIPCTSLPLLIMA